MAAASRASEEKSTWPGESMRFIKNPLPSFLPVKVDICSSVIS